MKPAPVFLFDGDCGFCSACAAFIQRRIPTRATVAAWQLTELAPLGVTAAECDDAVQWVEPGAGVRTSGPAAIASLLRDAGAGWRPLGWLLARRPMLALAKPVYRWVSRNRHRMPGGTPVCSLPANQRSAGANQRPSSDPDGAALAPRLRATPIDVDGL